MRTLKNWWLYAKALRALWNVGLLRLWPWMLFRIWLAWRHCRGSLAFLAEVATLRAGDRLALVDDDGALSYRELRVQYEALAAELLAHGLAGPGRQLAIVAHNHRRWVVALLAASRTGADVVLINPHSPAPVLAKLLRAPTTILHEPDIDTTKLPSDCPRFALTESSPGRELQLPPLRQAGRLCVLTAGSTGLPKRIGRRPSLGSVLPLVLGLIEQLPVTLYRPTVLAVPLFHGHGLATLAMALAFAAPVHLARRTEIAALLARRPIDPPPVVVSVPTLLARWLDAGPRNEKLAAVLTGSAPLEARLCRRLLDALGSIIYNLYGSSEAGVVSLATPSMLDAAPGTVGMPLPGTEVRLVGSQIAGRIQVRSPLIVGQDPQGWLDTGDLGVIDPAGLLHVRGRADGMFISGGENVYPQAIEATLLEHPAVAEAAIAVVPDAEFGARMRAYVVATASLPLTADELRAWLHQRLDRHEQPKSVELIATLPRNALGKIDRPALTKLAGGPQVQSTN